MGSEQHGRGGTTGNLLLDALDPATRDTLVSGSEALRIEPGKVYYGEGDPLDILYFPTGGVLSMVTRLADDTEVEAATTGREGFILAQVLLGSNEVGQETHIGQISGEMLAIDRAPFIEQVARSDRLRELTTGYLQALMAQMAFGVACNARHDIEHRCARWLLQTHDSIVADTFNLRQEFLAMMLGVQRQSVTIAAGSLQRAGFIRYRRGHVTIEDREGLESASCECYEKVRSEYSRVVPL